MTTQGVVVLDYGAKLSQTLDVQAGSVTASGEPSDLGSRVNVAEGDVASVAFDAVLAAQSNGSQTVYLGETAYSGNAAQMLSVTVDGVSLILLGS